MKNINIGLSDDYINADIGPINIYFGYEYTHCKHGFTFNKKCNCSNEQDSFAISYKNKPFYSLTRKEIEKRLQHKDRDDVNRMFIGGILIFIESLDINNIFNIAKTIVSKPKLVVCFTGFRDKFLEDAVKRIGGTVVKNITNDTTHLVMEDEDTITDKVYKAQEKDIKIITQEELVKLLKKKL